MTLSLISVSNVTIERNVGLSEPPELREVSGTVYLMCLNTLVTTSSVQIVGRICRICVKKIVFMKVLSDIAVCFVHIITDATRESSWHFKENRKWPGIFVFIIKEQRAFILALFCCGKNICRSNKMQVVSETEIRIENSRKRTREAYKGDVAY